MAGANNHGTSNGTTDVDVVTSPASGNSRLIPAGGLNIYNADTVVSSVTVQFTNGVNDRVLDKVELQTGDAWASTIPIVLDDTAEKIQIYLDSAVTTTELDWFTHYRDESQ
jgi:hypothetical protein